LFGGAGTGLDQGGVVGEIANVRAAVFFDRIVKLPVQGPVKLDDVTARRPLGPQIGRDIQIEAAAGIDDGVAQNDCVIVVQELGDRLMRVAQPVGLARSRCVRVRGVD
jgi:hypothetical protein